MARFAAHLSWRGSARARGVFRTSAAGVACSLFVSGLRFERVFYGEMFSCRSVRSNFAIRCRWRNKFSSEAEIDWSRVGTCTYRVLNHYLAVGCASEATGGRGLATSRSGERALHTELNLLVSDVSHSELSSISTTTIFNTREKPQRIITPYRAMFWYFS